ncbi:extracellular matrix regulator RemB [Mesobacillus maritimus]|uniref:extracellular matrix regulator RemB n=1 Tax=Mesobacillus maritimus TaxID=1643336 RepID=UPI00384B8E33
MYLHIGEDTLVRTSEIIAILDKESTGFSEVLEEFLTRQNLDVVHLSKKQYKSIVITTDQVYYSPLAAGTLKKRSQKSSVQEFII